MKRSPLRRRTPLTAAAGLSRRTRLRARSPKRSKLYREERVPMVAAILAVRTRCEIRWDASICGGRATTVHEPLSRGRGGSIVDPDNAMAACIPCNEAASANPDEAVRRGVLRHSWDRDREAA